MPHKQATDIKVIDDHDIRWVRTRPDWGLEPRWITEPNMAAVLEAVRDKIELQGPLKVKLHAEGAFTKLYTVEAQDREVVARVTMPVEPRLKTLSEVATLQWVRNKTKLPVPRVLAYNASRTYPVGYEWIIMEKVPGRTLADTWETMSYDSKEKLVRQVATFFSDCFSHQRRGIGNLMPPDTDWVVLENPLDRMLREDSGKGRTLSQKGMTVDRLVQADYCGYKSSQEVSRGPFATARQWISSRLGMMEHDYRRRLDRLRQIQEAAPECDESAGEEGARKGDTQASPVAEEAASSDASASSSSSGQSTIEPDEDDHEHDLLEVLDVASRLRSHLDKSFPPDSGEEPEPTIVFHHDLSSNNILIDESGNLSAVVDWEFVSALPLYAACDFPPFLKSYTVNKKPMRSEYEENGVLSPDSLYSEHVYFWELTQLRRLFLKEMKKLQPAWVGIFRKSQKQRDFDMAVSSCGELFSRKNLLEWLNDLESGEKDTMSLEERFDDLGLDM